MRKLIVPFSVALFLASFATAQTTSPAPTSGAASQPGVSTPSPDMAADLTAYGEMLGRLRDLAQRTAGDLGRIRIDKWKADSSVKQDSQSQAASLQRNLTAALPEIIQKAQAAPQDLAPSFKLYRNLNVVYDVLSVTAENAGAFGPKEQYEPLAADIGELDQLRRGLADRLDWLSGVRDSQLGQLRQQLAAAQQAASRQKQEASSDTSSTSTTKKPTPKKKKKPAPAPTDQTPQ